MKKILLIALIMVSLVLAGCGNSSENYTNTKTFVGGTNGVVMTFEQSAPPAEVIKGEEFNVVLILTNKGEFSIPADTAEKNGYSLKLKGFSPGDFSVDSTDLEITGTSVGEALPAAEINPDTGETIDPYDTYVTIPDGKTLLYKGGVSGNMEYPMTVEMCYYYETNAYGNLCVKENLQDSTDTDVCTIGGAKDVTSSGAPVQIRNLEEFSGGSNKIRFNFEIYNANANTKISSMFGDCTEAYNKDDYVFIEISTGLKGTLECNGLSKNTVGEGVADGEVKLSDGARKITCSQEIDSSEQGDYIKTISVLAKYKVQQSINTKVLIKNLGE